MNTFLEDGTSFIYRSVNNSGAKEVLPKIEEEKRFKREHQQPPKMDKKYSEDIGLKDEVTSEGC